MARRKPVANAGTYQMGRPVNQAGGSARNRPTPLQRLAIGNQYAGEFTAPTVNKVADPLGRNGNTSGFGRALVPAASAATWAAADAGSFAPIQRGTPAPAASPAPADNPYAAADAGLMLAATNNGGGGGSSTSVPSAAVPAAGGAPTAPPAPRVNPLDAIYQSLFESIGQNTEAGVAGYNDLLTRLGEQYGAAEGNIQGRLDDRNAFWDGQATDLASRVETQRGLGAQNMQNYQNVLAGITNPYGEGFAPSLTTTNQMADYLRATGVDPSQVDAMVSQASAENAQYDQMLNNANQTLGSSLQQANDMRKADALLMQQGFDQDLAGQQNALSAAMTSQRGNEIAGLNNELSNVGLARIAQELGINTDLLNFKNNQGQSLSNAQLDQAGNTQQYNANSENQSMNLLNNILNAYGGDLDPASVVELVTKFARTMGMPASQVMGAV